MTLQFVDNAGNEVSDFGKLLPVADIGGRPARATLRFKNGYPENATFKISLVNSDPRLKMIWYTKDTIPPSGYGEIELEGRGTVEGAIPIQFEWEATLIGRT
jgi:hypothetical protein